MFETGGPENTTMHSAQARIGQTSANLHHALTDKLDAEVQSGHDRGLLAGDADRQSAEAQLRLAYTRGYLSDEGLERRLAMAVAAEYQEDLRRLLADVPESQLELRRPSLVTPTPAIPPLEPLPQDIFIDDRPHASREYRESWLASLMLRVHSPIMVMQVALVGVFVIVCAGRILL